jgi:hypothetical protein
MNQYERSYYLGVREKADIFYLCYCLIDTLDIIFKHFQLFLSLCIGMNGRGRNNDGVSIARKPS